MAMAKITLVVCDICESPERKTTNYVVTGGEKRRVLDLCDEHAAPLRELLGDPAAKRRPGRQPGSRRMAVTTVDAIEKDKAKP